MWSAWVTFCPPKVAGNERKLLHETVAHGWRTSQTHIEWTSMETPIQADSLSIQRMSETQIYAHVLGAECRPGAHGPNR